MIDTFAAVRACALALLAGVMLHADDVTAGEGRVIDWRTVKSGEEIQAGGDTFATAHLFVALVGPTVALAGLAALDMEPEPAAPIPDPVRVDAYAIDPNVGGRRRVFDVGPFRVLVEPNEDDAAQAAFTMRLAVFAATIAK